MKITQYIPVYVNTAISSCRRTKASIRGKLEGLEGSSGAPHYGVYPACEPWQTQLSFFLTRRDI